MLVLILLLTLTIAPKIKTECSFGTKDWTDKDWYISHNSKSIEGDLYVFGKLVTGALQRHMGKSNRR
jgi:hypothetical protein